MKLSYKSISALVAAVLLLSSCIEETFPQGSTQTQDQISTSDTGVKGMLNSIPASLVQGGIANHLSRYGDQLDFGIASIHIRTDHMLEDIAILGDNPGYDYGVKYSIVNGFGSEYVSCSYFWECYYPWIKLANDVIKSIDPQSPASQLELLGQAYAYRAMFYLDLARIYEPKENNYTDVSNVLGLTVPIVTETTTEEQAKNNPRANRADMYKFIISDLEAAEKYLANMSIVYTKPSISAIYGLFARTYLEMGYWNEGEAGDIDAFAKAAEYARKAIETSGKTPLTESQWTDPANGFNNGNANNSWIWGLGVTTNNINNLIAWPAHFAMEAVYGYGPSSHIGLNKATYERIKSGDFRKKSWLDPNWTGFGGNYICDYKFAGSKEDAQKYIEGAKPYESLKFRPAQGNVNVWQVGNLADVVLMRVEEMYFIEMEAVAHKDLGQAKELLNSFMNQFRMTKGSSYDCQASAGNLENFLDEMLFQKRIEFWGEGIVYNDYKRLGKGITRGYKGTNHAEVLRYNSNGMSPLLNIVITRLEYQSNTAINDSNNNPDPSGKLILWTDK